MRLSWLLVDELAIGSSPITAEDLDRLELEGFRSVFSLCDSQEAPPPGGLERRFYAARLVLPDFRSGRPPTLEEIQASIACLSELIRLGPLYMHCVAGIERSPLVAVAWLMLTRDMTLQAALDYVQCSHPGTSPLPGQLAVLRSWSSTLAAPVPDRPFAAA